MTPRRQYLTIFTMALSHYTGAGLEPEFKQEADGLFTSEFGHWKFAVRTTVDVPDFSPQRNGPAVAPANRVTLSAQESIVPDAMFARICASFETDLPSCVLESKRRIRAKHSARFQEINQSTACAPSRSTRTAQRVRLALSRVVGSVSVTGFSLSLTTKLSLLSDLVAAVGESAPEGHTQNTQVDSGLEIHGRLQHIRFRSVGLHRLFAPPA